MMCVPLSGIRAQHSVENESNSRKPWTRWWWMGNAVDSIGIRYNLEMLAKAGIGGVEITPIYGVKGQEGNTIPYLSDEWIAMLNFTLKIADSLHMGVDMTLGTGWPYGGPQVEPEFAARKLIGVKTILDKGQSFKAAVGDSVEKGRPMKLLGIYAYGKSGSYIDLTSEIKNSKLKFKAKKEAYVLYKVYEALTGQQVKRAAPGSEGYTVDHYSKAALEDYVEPFDEAFSKLDGSLRSVFNDSYEVYGTDFTPLFLTEFEKRRGYDLKPHLNIIFEKRDDPESNRILGDYRETISDLLLEEFDRPWTAWANEHQLKSRLQAHGSPGNLIDLYAAADIPECETFGSMPYDIPGLRREAANIRPGDADPAMLKFSSSAAHISGKPLVSSETFTWLREHFMTALSQCKPEVEDLFLNGINHVFLHGSTYSPPSAQWPGWKFYASVNFNYNNSIWEHADGLFSYIENCQQYLQQGTPDNEVLLYYPVYDTWNSFLKGNTFFQFKIHSLDEWLLDTSFYTINRALMDEGYGVDFISDRFTQTLRFENDRILTPGGEYQAMVIPACQYIPLETLQKLLELKSQGARIIFKDYPGSVPGFHDYKVREGKLKELLKDLKVSGDPIASLKNNAIYGEPMVQSGLKFIRRDLDGEKIYFIVNHTGINVEEVTLKEKVSYVSIYDPLTGKEGQAMVIENGGGTTLKLNIAPGESYFLKTSERPVAATWAYAEANDYDFYSLDGPWKLQFRTGGPDLPPNAELDTLKTWTLVNKEAESFSGMVEYTTTIDLPESAPLWELDLGIVRESAKVWINGKYAGMLWSVPFRLKTDLFKKGVNEVKIQIVNLPANRIRALELRGEEWKIFHEINMVNKDYQKFDAAPWDLTPSGLLGPVVVKPLKRSY
ncbi:glycoside hydrolase [Robertkochia solimangrovi]|nr:glycoside hydrolase [Robertkochia solimangrovi]